MEQVGLINNISCLNISTATDNLAKENLTPSYAVQIGDECLINMISDKLTKAKSEITFKKSTNFSSSAQYSRNEYESEKVLLKISNNNFKFDESGKFYHIEIKEPNKINSKSKTSSFTKSYDGEASFLTNKRVRLSSKVIILDLDPLESEEDV